MSDLIGSLIVNEDGCQITNIQTKGREFGILVIEPLLGFRKIMGLQNSTPTGQTFKTLEAAMKWLGEKNAVVSHQESSKSICIA